MKLHSVNAGYFKLDGGAMFGVVPKSLWNKANPADENNMCLWAMRSLLIEHGNHRILIDTGMGDKQDEKFFSHYYPSGDSLEQNLAKIGFTPNDITDVFLTHMHFDHVGGAVKKNETGALVPTFPNSQYWTNRAHWALATAPNEREKASFLKENILPLEEQGVLRFIEGGDGDEWIDDIRIRFASGHTEAMMLPQIRINGKTILFCADLLPSVHHLPMPWVMAYDMRPMETLKEKKQMLQEAVSNDWILFLQHDPQFECCTLKTTEKGIRLKDTFELSEMEAFG